jgi:hypothetical protein
MYFVCSLTTFKECMGKTGRQTFEEKQKQIKSGPLSSGSFLDVLRALLRR